MKTAILYLTGLTTVGMLVGALVIMKYSISIILVSMVVATMFAVVSVVLVFRKSFDLAAARAENSSSKHAAIKGLFFAVGLGFVSALMAALQNEWDVGYTIGACFLSVVLILLIREYLRKQ